MVEYESGLEDSVDKKASEFSLSREAVKDLNELFAWEDFE